MTVFKKVSAYYLGKNTKGEDISITRMTNSDMCYTCAEPWRATNFETGDVSTYKTLRDAKVGE